MKAAWLAKLAGDKSLRDSTAARQPAIMAASALSASACLNIRNILQHL